MNQKGLVNIVLIVLVVILAGTTGYFVLRKSGTTVTDKIFNPQPSELTLEDAARSIPGAPEDVVVEKFESNKTRVTWKPFGPDIVYHIFVARADENITSKTPMRLVGSSRQPSFIDETPPTDTNLVYAVSAFNMWGNESRKSLSPRFNLSR